MSNSCFGIIGEWKGIKGKYLSPGWCLILRHVSFADFYNNISSMSGNICQIHTGPFVFFTGSSYGEALQVGGLDSQKCLPLENGVVCGDFALKIRSENDITKEAALRAFEMIVRGARERARIIERNKSSDLPLNYIYHAGYSGLSLEIEEYNKERCLQYTAKELVKFFSKRSDPDPDLDLIYY